MNKQLVKDGLVWGFILWLAGYLLGILAFMVVPASMIGWVVTPIGLLITTWVLYKKINSNQFVYYLAIGVFWVLVAVVFDYLFLVRLFSTPQAYYKTDVYLYYASAIVLPLFVGWYKLSRKNPNKK